ncbi:MAG: CRISPR-associated endonuclease Cas1 [Fimbriimonadaceae bacterium]|nr:CRISPR-associated endonuclease Cas1 [Fimbriimonadaceae bacterium]
MSSVFIDEPGTRIGRDHERLELTRDGELLASLKLQDLSLVVFCDYGSVTSAALEACLQRGIAVAFVSRGGELLGRLEAPHSAPAEARRQQWLVAQDPAAREQLSRALLVAKLSALLHRVARWSREGAALDHRAASLDSLLRGLPDSPASGLLGVEGAASRAYFDALGVVAGPDWAFQRRARRPPPDPLNALLGFLYALVENEVATACVGAGLDLDVGFLHTLQDRRESLVLDLLEEFRPLLADAVALRLLGRRQLGATDFEPAPEDGVWLTERGRGIVFRELERQLSSTVALRDAPPRTWREHVRDQAAAFSAAIEQVAAGQPPVAYQPLAAGLR